MAIYWQWVNLLIAIKGKIVPKYSTVFFVKSKNCTKYIISTGFFANIILCYTVLHSVTLPGSVAVCVSLLFLGKVLF